MFDITEKNIINPNIIQQSSNSTTNISHNPKITPPKNYFGVKSTSTVVGESSPSAH